MKRGEINKLDKQWSLMIREDMKERCTICGKGDGTRMNPHHFVGRRSRSTRWYFPNGICLCSGCHTLCVRSAHQNPEWFRGEMLLVRGKEWLDDVMKQSNKICKVDYQTVKDYLDGKRDNYC